MYAVDVDSAAVLHAAMAHAAISASELARRSGLGRSTIYRYLEGRQDPSLSTLDDILAVVGLKLRTSADELSDPAAATALLALLSHGPPPEADTQNPWIERLTRISVRSLRDALLLGGSVGSVLRRPGTVGLTAPSWEIDRLVSAGQASRASWALSGGAALDALGHDLDAPTILWTESARTVVQLLNDTFSTTDPGRAELIVADADPQVFLGATVVEDVLLVNPRRAYVDALGLDGDAASLALDILERQLDDR